MCGTFEGPGLKGTIIPGGWDWQLIRADGCVNVHADYMLRTDDGVIINVVNDGALCVPKAGEAPKPARTSPRFEAPLGKYEWLGQTAFVGTLEGAKGPNGEPAVRIRFYKAVEAQTRNVGIVSARADRRAIAGGNRGRRAFVDDSHAAFALDAFRFAGNRVRAWSADSQSRLSTTSGKIGSFAPRVPVLR